MLYVTIPTKGDFADPVSYVVLTLERCCEILALFKLVLPVGVADTYPSGEHADDIPLS